MAVAPDVQLAAGPDAVAVVRMLAFAGARDAIGAAEVVVPWGDLAALSRERPGGGGDAVPTAADVLELACSRWPALAPWKGCLRVAVNGSYAAAGDPVAAGDEIALIPPVAGG
jgi:molybdopterin synthase sulfur carrier subunit